MKHTTLAAAALVLFSLTALLSCSKETDEDSQSVQERILKAYIELNYPGCTPTESGLYVVDRSEGSGAQIKDSSYVLLDYDITYLNGTYVSYTSEETARQLGAFSNSDFYGPQIWYLPDTKAGVREILTGLKEGGHVKAVIPAWLLDVETESTIYDSDGSTKIYDIYVRKVVPDIKKYEIDQLEEYSKKGLSKIDSLSYGFYFYRNKISTDTLANETSYSVRYVGRYLDGKVFDTNIPDTAKRHRIYTGSDENYEPLTFKYSNDWNTVLEKNSFVKGFNKALFNMKLGERATTFFWSELGYGTEGKDKIPGYMPLCFELYIYELE